MKWFFPSWNGDLRLEQKKDDENVTLLHIEKPTNRETEILGIMGTKFVEQGWLKEFKIQKKLFKRTKPIEIAAPLDKVGPVVTEIMRPGPAVLTGILLKDGQMITHSGAELAKTVETVQAEVLKKPEKTPKAIVTVKRHTPCCPQCVPGSIEPAREVLLSFLNKEEHASWAKDRTIVVTGGLSGHRYLLAHRHTVLAQRVGRICYDLDDNAVVHFHDWTVPPEEEVLAAKLILEHREPWLRNEATMLGMLPNGASVSLGASNVFKNPFGDIMDGTLDAGFTQGLGGFFQAFIERLKP